ncbi:MAG: HNH endonuclease [Propionibacteriaceae bacterium]|jgi:hypothetical protein|nr:HNH endonuclease [Propionibacteriaceae bacterium]
METSTVGNTKTAFEAVSSALDLACADTRQGLEARARLELVRVSQQLKRRLDALVAELVAEADRAGASEQVARVSMTDWLALGTNLTHRAARAQVATADALAENPALRKAALAGQVDQAQTTVIAKALEAVPASSGVRAEAETLLVDMAARMDANRLARQADAAIAALQPEPVATADERLARQAEQAYRNRYLQFTPDQRGSVRFSGQLPTIEAGLWIAQLDAYRESERRKGLDTHDPKTCQPTPGQRYADALSLMVQDCAKKTHAPANGGDRPTVFATMHIDWLREQARKAGNTALVGAGCGYVGEQPLTAKQLRMLCCDADIIPVVLGSESEILDVGRTNRLVTKPIRHALTLRDGGCAFPGCETPPARCEAHHIRPWQVGGPTALDNLVLLCHHHHAQLEPDPHREQWQVRINPVDRQPEFIPPASYDPDRKPRRHNRITTRQTQAPPGLAA